MSPRVHFNSLVNCGLGYAASLSQHFVWRIVTLALQSSKPYQFVCKLVRIVLLTRGGRPSVPSFGVPVIGVLSPGSKPEVGWPDTPWDIALVTHAKTIWNRPKCHNPRRPVRCDIASANTTPYLAIPKTKSGCRPQPTRVGLFNLSPKSLWKVLRKPLRSQILRSKFWLHSVSSFDCLPRLGLFQQRQGFLIL